MIESSDHYRWNVNPTWESFSSMVQEFASAKEANNEFIKCHHLKSSLYFGIGTIESFLNETLRKKYVEEKIDEKKIFKQLRYTPFSKKLKKWPVFFAEKDIQFPENLIERIVELTDRRDNITHPKHKNHNIYQWLEQLEYKDIPSLISMYIVSTLEAMGKPFQYWLFEWNFIGFNRNDKYPALMPNSQFLFSLKNMGFNVPVYMADPMKEWEQTNMCSLQKFNEFRVILKKVNHCEAFDSRYPQRPRLCRRWWDKEHMTVCGKGNDIND